MAVPKKKLEQFRTELNRLRGELTHHLEESTAEVKRPDESKGYSQHQADEGTDDFERTISLQLTTAEMDLLHLIDRALEKIDEGTYGVCDLTGDEILLARLEAIPYATMTREAQEQIEKEGGQ